MRSVLLGVLLLLVVTTVEAAAQGLRAAAFGATGSKYVEVFADGNLKAALGQKSDDNPQSASGSLGVLYRTDKLIAQFVINAVGQAEAVRGNFGASLLPPASGNSLSAGLMDITWVLVDDRALCNTVAVHSYVSVSSAKWIHTPASSTEQEYAVVTGGGGAGMRCQFFGGPVVPNADDDPDENSNTVAVYLDVGLAFRTIGGDVASTANDAVRESLLGTTKRQRLGVEVGLGIQVNGVKAGLTFYGFHGEIPGLSDGQVVAGFSVQSAIFKGFMK